MHSRSVHSRYVHGSAIAMMLAIASLATSVQAQHPNHPLGFGANRQYQGAQTGLDHIDLFTGTLQLTVPIGPFTLTYNSNVWRYRQELDGSNVYITARPDGETTAGLGWHLGLGEVYSQHNLYNDTNRWLYVDGSGGHHVFFSDLHYEESEGDPNDFYTRDGTFLRLRTDPNHGWVEIDFPNGSTHRFDSGTGGLQTTYRLSHTWSAHGSQQDPDLTVTYIENTVNEVETRMIVDRWGRTHYVHLRTDEPWINRVVDEVDIEAFDGQRARYDFTYETVPVDVSCKQTNPKAEDRISVPHLVRIDLPDGTFYSMKDGTQRLYHNVCAGGIEDLPGALQGLWLPTGGKLAWTYQEYEFPPGEVNSPFNTSVGVATRQTVRANGSVDGSWTYRTAQVGFDGGNDPEVTMEVVTPTGDCTRNYFNARYALDVQPVQRGWEYALPFVARVESGGAYLSREVWTDHDASGACAGTKLRSQFVRYRRDTLPGQTNDRAAWLNSNRIPEASRTVYHDDGDRYRHVERSEYDGLGHFRRSVTTGTFRNNAPNDERREVFVAYDKVAGVYPGSFTPIPASEPWVLDVHSAVEVQELDTHGNDTRRTELQFDPATGGLVCTRRLANGTTRGPHDIVTRLTRDSLGQVTSTRMWGSDLNPIPTTGDGCGSTPGPAAAEDRYAYALGVRTKVTPFDGSGQPAPFDRHDVTLDPSTGLPIQQRDRTGYPVDLTYDVVGRLVERQAHDGSRTTYEHLAASAGTPAQTKMTRRGANGFPVLSESIETYDDFGRLASRRVRQPGGTWTEQTIERNARGWVEAVSQWGDSASQTEFLDFDPFGRPSTIRESDGGTHEVIYEGERRETVRSMTVTPTGPMPVTKIEERDAHGRLCKVSEPSGPGGAWTATQIEYDVDGRMTRSTSGANPSQVRAYVYDNRGFLLSETVPEKGVGGNGTVYYLDHDVRGRPQRKLDGPNDLAFTYDDFGRLTTIRDNNHGGRLLTEYVYDGALGWGQGRLWYAERHNWVDLPWNAGGVEDVRIRQTYRYEAPLGGLSRLETRYRWGARDVAFEQVFGHDDDGQRTSHRYPACGIACAGTEVEQGRTISYGYDRGWMVSVPGWATSIAYNDAGVWSSVVRANGVEEVRDFDPSAPVRASRLQVLAPDGTTVYFDSGERVYDDAGNPIEAGNDRFRYDRVGRLAEATVHGSQSGGVDPWLETYQYDAFGNMTAKTTSRWSGPAQTVTYGVDSATNRLSAGGYDGAGNLVGWGGSNYTYDPFNRLDRAAWMRYLYDATGERVGAFAQAGSEHMWFLVRDDGGRLASEISWDTNSGYTRHWDYVRAGNRLLGRVDADDFVEHYHVDQFGSLRLITRAAGELAGDLDFTPYGESFTPDNEDHTFNFAGHERAHSSGLDAMHARFYASALARFLSVDPVAGAPGAPQSLNRYSYANGNPMVWVDPDGRDEVKTYVKQNAPPHPMPSNWNLQVFKEVGSLGPGMRGAERALGLVVTLQTGGLAGLSLGQMAFGGTVHAAIDVGILGFTTGGSLGDYGAAAAHGFEVGVFSTVGLMLPFFGLTGELVGAAAVAGAAHTLPPDDVHVLPDGGFILVFSDGTTKEYDKDGHFVAHGETVDAAAGDGAGDAKTVDFRGQSDPDILRYQEERGLRGWRELNDFRCMSNPGLCFSPGGGDRGGVDTRWQFY